MTLSLTEKQERVWRYIKSCERSPTYAEMERDLGMTVSNISAAIDRLRERGYVSFIRGKSRTLVAVDPGVLSRYSTKTLLDEIARRAS